MKVLMFGWEFPPWNQGGLGTACYGLTKGLSHHGAEVIFVLPRAPPEANGGHVKLVSASSIKGIRFKTINSPLVGYMTSEEYQQKVKEGLLTKKESSGGDLYGKDLFEEVERFALKARLIAESEEFDVIHAHDWLTYKAGVIAKQATGKPLVVHMHATEFDRTGGNGVNQYVYDIEKKGMQEADAVICVSNFTRQMVVDRYGIDPGKLYVVHNAVEFTNFKEPKRQLSELDKVVLFLGRITLQKGPDYFIETARKVIDYEPKAKFVVAGNGDMLPRMIHRAAELGIGDKVLFAGFLKGEDIDRAYKMASLYVMPSVSEPFGITPLEAMRNGTPVLISKQSGVSEVISNCLKTDFWDIDEMANKIVSVLRYKPLHESLSEDGSREVKKFNWDIPAKKCLDVYTHAIDAVVKREYNQMFRGGRKQ